MSDLPLVYVDHSLRSHLWKSFVKRTVGLETFRDKGRISTEMEVLT